MNKGWKKAGVLLLAIVLLAVTACSGGGNEGNNAGGNNGNTTNTTNADNGNTGANTGTDNAGEEAPVKEDPLGAYPETVKVTTVLKTNPEEKFPEGETYESNKYKTLMEQKLNIKIDFAWSAPAGDTYKNKFNLMIASNDLPDIFVVEDQDQVPAKVLLNRLVKNGMIEDLTEVYEKYASDRVKDIHNSINGEALKEATYDGKLMALPTVGDTAGTTPIVWVRQDWLDKLGLPAPDSVENLIKVAKAFKENDMNGNGKKDELGLATQKELYSDGGPFSVDPLFWTMNAYPKYWVKDDSGQLVYGGIQPQVKETLTLLADLFKQGIIEKEFPLKGGNELTPNIGSGTAGLLFGQWWNPFWPLGDSWKNDPNAVWKAYTLKNADGLTKTGSNYHTNMFLVVRKGYANPEVAVKINNYHDASAEMQEIIDLDEGLYKGEFSKKKFGAGFDVAYKDTVLRSVVKFRDILAGKAQTDVLDPAEKSIYEQIKRNADRMAANQPITEQNFSDHQIYVGWMEGIGAVTDSKLDVTYNGFGSTTPTMDTKWTALMDLQLKSYYKIIMGEEDLSYFDTFVQQWKSQGGDAITKEVNEASSSQQ